MQVKTSIPIINRKEDSGCWCQTPLEHWNLKTDEPLTSMQDLDAPSVFVVQIRHSMSFLLFFLHQKMSSLAIKGPSVIDALDKDPDWVNHKCKSIS